MSVRDLPDYTREMVIKYTGGFIGLEELATRLGSIVPYDLRGNIVLMEDFESELTEWYDDSSIVTCTATRSSRHKFSGDWSAKLYTIGTPGESAALERYFNCPGLSKYAVFMRMMLDDDTWSIGFFLSLLTGTQEFYMEVRYDRWPSETLKVRTTGAAWHTVATVDLNLEDPLWIPLLVTFDLTSKTYDKLYFADREYDVSDVVLDYSESGAAQGGYLEISTAQEGTVIFTVYVDDIIIAKNVP